MRESTGGSKTLYIVLALFRNALYKLRGWSGGGGTMAKCGKLVTPHPFFSGQLVHIKPHREELPGAMTIWSISLKAHKSLSGLDFSTYQDAGKKVLLPW